MIDLIVSNFTVYSIKGPKAISKVSYIALVYLMQ